MLENYSSLQHGISVSAQNKKLQNMHKKLSTTNKNIFPLLKTDNTPENIKDLRWSNWAQVYYKVRKIES